MVLLNVKWLGFRIKEEGNLKVWKVVVYIVVGINIKRVY